MVNKDAPDLGFIPQGGRMLDFVAVVEIGLALPGVTEGASYGARALKLKGKLLACVPVNKSAEADSLVISIHPERRTELLRDRPETFYVTDHYVPYPKVLVRLAAISRADLRSTLAEAYDFVMTQKR